MDCSSLEGLYYKVLLFILQSSFPIFRSIVPLRRYSTVVIRAREFQDRISHIVPSPLLHFAHIPLQLNIDPVGCLTPYLRSLRPESVRLNL